MLAIAVVALLVCFPAMGSTQGLTDPNQGNIRFTGNFDFANAYMFRGLRQDDTGLIMWPSVDAGINLHKGTGTVESADLHVGTWNSLHTGLAGLDGPTGRLWYENRIYGTLDVGLSAGVNVGTTFTAYTSPNGSFSTVKELAFRVGSGRGLCFRF